METDTPATGPPGGTEEPGMPVPAHSNQLGDYCPHSGTTTGDGYCPIGCLSSPDDDDTDVFEGTPPGTTQIPQHTTPGGAWCRFSGMYSTSGICRMCFPDDSPEQPAPEPTPSMLNLANEMTRGIQRTYDLLGSMQMLADQVIAASEARAPRKQGSTDKALQRCRAAWHTIAHEPATVLGGPDSAIGELFAQFGELDAMLSAGHPLPASWHAMALTALYLRLCGIADEDGNWPVDKMGDLVIEMLHEAGYQVPA